MRPRWTPSGLIRTSVRSLLGCVSTMRDNVTLFICVAYCWVTETVVRQATEVPSGELNVSLYSRILTSPTTMEYAPVCGHPTPSPPYEPHQSLKGSPTSAELTLVFTTHATDVPSVCVITKASRTRSCSTLGQKESASAAATPGNTKRIEATIRAENLRIFLSCAWLFPCLICQTIPHRDLLKIRRWDICLERARGLPLTGAATQIGLDLLS